MTERRRHVEPLIDVKSFAELMLLLAPTPEDRTDLAGRLGIQPWGYSSKTDWVDVMVGLVTLSQEDLYQRVKHAREES